MVLCVALSEVVVFSERLGEMVQLCFVLSQRSFGNTDTSLYWMTIGTECSGEASCNVPSQ